MPFKKGRSGNPGGRRKGVSDIIRAKTKDGALIVETLLDVIRTAGKGQDRVAAARLLLEYGFSKPPTETEVSGPGGSAIPIQVITGVPSTPVAQGDEPPASP